MEDKRTEIRQDTELTSVSAEEPADLEKYVGKDEPAETSVSAEAGEPGNPAESSVPEIAAETAETADTPEPSGAAEETGSAEEAETAAEAETVEETESAEEADQTETSEEAEETDAAEAGETEKAVYPVPAGPGDDGSDGNGRHGGGGSDGNGPHGGGGRPPASRSRRIAFWIALFIVLAIAGGIYYAGYQYCLTHFMPGTQINGYDCSKMTVEEAEGRFEEAAQEYVLNVRFRGGETEILHAKDIGFAYKPDGSIDALLQGQDCMQWPKYLFEDSGYRIDVSGTVDEEKLKQALQQLPELQEENMEAPENAYVKFQDGNEEDGRFVIIPDKEGSTIDLVQLTAGVADAACKYQDLVDAEEIAGAYVPASVRADNAKLVSRCKDLNDIVGASITYILPDGETIRLNADVTKDWLVRDDKGKLTKDDDVWEEKLWEFLQELANNANTLGMRRRFHSSLRGTITVSGGDYGYMVNQIVEHDLLLEDFAGCRKETRKPSYYLTPYNEETENDGIGTSYIEADLTAQHIWCYVDGKLAMESDCVSGNMDDGHETPAGVFGIMFMKKDATLRGVMQKDGEYEYETKVKYWMPFYDGCGFHDAWWRTAFGGDIYMKDGSHGCINLPPEAAEQLFSVCDNKMPVVVYY